MDVIVIGAGHNGLTAATMLARRGKKVLVLERREQVGGTAAGETFHPGFSHSGILHDSHHVRPAVVKGLGLSKHGLELRDPPDVQGRTADGGRMRLGTEASDVGEDAAGLASLRAVLDKVSAFASGVLDRPAPEIGADADLLPLAKPAIGLRRLGRKDMMEVLRIGPTCVDDFVAEHLSEPALRAMVCMPALPMAWMGPRSPLSTANLLLGEALSGREVVGGPAALVRALAAAAQAAGVEVRTGTGVSEIRVEDDKVVGVRLEDGTDIAASTVLAAIGPRRALLDLVDPMHLPGLTERALSNVRLRGAVAKIHLALSGPLTFADGEAVERARLVAHPLDLERAFDDAKYGRLPTRPPPLEVRVLSGEGFATGGGCVASILVFGVPHDLRTGWDDGARQSLFDSALASLERYCPGVRDLLVGHEVLTPADLETRFDLEGGHLAHGEHALDQLYSLRPTPELAQYRTPIEGLWLGSSGCHPGGGITCAPGALAAQAMIASTTG